MWGLIAGALIGTMTSAVVAIWIEYLRRPLLQISIETAPIEQVYMQNMPAKTGRSLRVKLFNKPLPSWVRWMVREPALQCKATIGFHHLDNQDVFGRIMEGRWASSPEPVNWALMPGVTVVGPPLATFSLGKMGDTSRVDVYPGDSETLDIVARFDNDAECYGWNDEAYFSDPLWRNPNWKLDHGRYVVEVVVRSSGQTCVGQFRLINDVPRNAFRLQPSS